MVHRVLALILLGLCGAVQAEQIVSTGSTNGYTFPVVDDPSQRPLSIEVMLGYGTPETSIGEGIWISGAGDYDYSTDPHLAAFLSMATDGIAEPMTIRLRDRNNITCSYLFDFGDASEFYLLGSYPDLAGLGATGVQFHVLELQTPNSATAFPGGIEGQWMATTVPEPTTILALGSLLISTGLSRRRGTENGTGKRDRFD